MIPRPGPHPPVERWLSGTRRAVNRNASGRRRTGRGTCAQRIAVVQMGVHGGGTDGDRMAIARVAWRAMTQSHPMGIGRSGVRLAGLIRLVWGWRRILLEAHAARPPPRILGLTFRRNPWHSGRIALAIPTRRSRPRSLIRSGRCRRNIRLARLGGNRVVCYGRGARHDKSQDNRSQESSTPHDESPPLLVVRPKLPSLRGLALRRSASERLRPS